MNIAQLCAAFSLDVYRDKQRPPLPENWTVYLDSHHKLLSHGYFGSAYIQTNADANSAIPINVVVAHRGTDSFKDIVEDLEMWAFHKTPAQFTKEAIPFINQVIKKIKNDNTINTVNLYFTGHSLGATLAELSLAYYIADFFTDTDSICLKGAIDFESPGSKPLIESLINAGKIPSQNLGQASQLLQTYNADTNIINTCMEHITPINYAHAVGYSWIADPIHGYPLTPGTEYFGLNFTVKDQHKMLKMYDYMSNDSTIENTHYKRILPHQWPVGIDSALQTYLNYHTPFIYVHSHYWDQYIQLSWENNPKIHTEYNSEYEMFRNDFQQTVLLHNYEKAFLDNIEKLKHSPLRLALQQQLNQLNTIPKNKLTQLQQAFYRHLQQQLSA